MDLWTLLLALLESFLRDPTSIVTTGAIGIGVLLLLRLIRLAATGGESPAAPGPSRALTVSAPIAEPPAPARRPWFPSRAARMAEEAEINRTETELIRSEADRLMARIDKARAKGGLVQATAELQQILDAHAPKKAVPPTKQQKAKSPVPALTLQEIEQCADLLDLDTSTRARLTALVRACLEEKQS